MSRFYPVISKDLDKQFRETVAARKGFHKGALSEAVSEAMHLWIKENSLSGFKNSDRNLTRNSKSTKARRN